MCARIRQDLDLEMLSERYRLPATTPALNLKPRYIGYPADDFVAVRRESEERTLAKLRWGLVPHWVGLKVGTRLTHACSETVHEKPAFRAAFRRRRCVVPVNGWFEWRRGNGENHPYWIRAVNADVVSLAAIWARWENEDEPIETFSVLTTAASPALAEINHRQPVIVDDAALDEWLDPGTPSERLRAVAGAANEGPFETRAVSTRIDNPRHDDTELLAPL